MPDTDQLVVRLLGNVVRTVPLVQQILTIGRTPDNNLPLPHPQVSRRHAEIRREGTVLTLTDLDSSNGTFVGQQPLLPNQPRPLSPGEAFSIGPFELTYETSLPREDAPAGASTPEQPIVVARIATPPPPPPRPPAPPRPTFPAAPPTGPASRYLRYLPVIYQEDDFLARYLMIAESIWEPLEERQDHVEMYLDPGTCPASFLPWLASWLGLPIDRGWPEGRQRRVLAAAMELLAWRGTSYGLSRAIEVCTGLVPTIEDLPNQPFVVRIRVRVPPGLAIDRELIESLVQAHKPAHAGYVLEVES